MRSLEELRRLWAAVPPRPRTRGTVELIVIRPNRGQRLTPHSVEISPERGVHGDRWSQGDEPELEGQVTLMNARVAEVIADDGDHALFGDNFLVDLDLAEDAAPTGSRLRIGTALIEITPLPHTGCEQYRERFGVDALRWVQHKSNRWERLRGIHCRVIEAGTVALGDSVAIVELAQAAGASAPTS